MIKLLFVEDDDNYAYAIQGGLELFDVYDIRRAINGKEAFEIYNNFCPDVVVSDVEMPELDGYDLARAIRAKDENVIILLATGLTSPKDLRKGYKLDIDEYVKKPYIADELHDRIQAILKRLSKVNKSNASANKENENIVFVGGYVMDTLSQTLSFDDMMVQKLTPRETDILLFLHKNQNCLVARTDILQRFWKNDDPEFASRSLDVFISKLRKYLSHDTLIKIENIRGKGLKLVVG